ncbi:MAG: gamma-glutamyl-gamma-aminobutyrate hydrolase family protein [Actinobacteria bacterium]|nr:gamma-glutamyl-gamma-aminobutyrate hydrolase family protein [Actinomycetota bacterium]
MGPSSPAEAVIAPRRPVIAITCQRRVPGNAFPLEPALVVISDYVDAVWRAGGFPVPVFPAEDGTGDVEMLASSNALSVLDQVDGVIAIGGLDVDPTRYGEVPHESTRPAWAPQERFELALLEGALERGTPLLAICRGAQLLNVMLGGTLHQHITGAAGWGAHGVPNGGGGSTNEFHLLAESLAARVTGAAALTGRCHHHQAVAAVAPGLRVTGRTADGGVEVLELIDPRGWMLAVQWHPEETAATDPANQALFDALVQASS